MWIEFKIGFRKIWRPRKIKNVFEKVENQHNFEFIVRIFFYYAFDTYSVIESNLTSLCVVFLLFSNVNRIQNCSAKINTETKKDTLITIERTVIDYYKCFDRSSTVNQISEMSNVNRIQNLIFEKVENQHRTWVYKDNFFFSVNYLLSGKIK